MRKKQGFLRRKGGKGHITARGKKRLGGRGGNGSSGGKLPLSGRLAEKGKKMLNRTSWAHTRFPEGKKGFRLKGERNGHRSRREQLQPYEKSITKWGDRVGSSLEDNLHPGTNKETRKM